MLLRAVRAEGSFEGLSFSAQRHVDRAEQRAARSPL